MTFSQQALQLFSEATKAYHVTDSIDAPMPQSAPSGIDGLLFKKNWIDAVQWHMEDLIRDPAIDPLTGMELKRRIDRSNQERTDLVEQIDDYFLDHFSKIEPLPQATINTESPAWALDRLSILVLKIWHMEQECARNDAEADYLERSHRKLNVLKEQQQDLVGAIDALLSDMEQGKKYMKVYRQMKMYNDAESNPVLRKSQSRG